MFKWVGDLLGNVPDIIREASQTKRSLVVFLVIVVVIIVIIALFVLRTIPAPVWQSILGMFQRGKPDQAAAICYRYVGESIEILLTHNKEGKYWIFPKGNIKRREPPWETAKQKASEEAGVRGRIEEKPLTTFLHLKGDTGELKVVAFLLRVETVETPEEENRNPTWFSPDEAKKALLEDRNLSLRYADELTRVVDEAYKEIIQP